MREFAQSGALAHPPKPASIERSRTGIDRWIEAAERCDGSVDRVRELLADDAGRAMAEAIFGNSPFLTHIVESEPAFAIEIFRSDPAIVLAKIHDDLELADDPELDEGEVRRMLRIAKRRVALATAVADLAGTLDVARITRALSDFADATIGIASRHLLRRMAASGTIRLSSEHDPETGSGLIVLGLGKLGSRELNYSSDVDLIVFYDNDLIDAPDASAVQQGFVRLARNLVSLLSERTEDGYVFRTDLRLRPDPGATPLAMSVLAAETYYESLGQNWERAAMIRVRQVAGDRSAGAQFLDRLRPFVWRKNLDFATIQDIHSIKRQIHAHHGGAAIAIAGHNVKLGRGGIREIEFFAQTQQLIWGGRVPSLRSSGTGEALAALAAEGRVAEAVAHELAESYWFLRRVEHRLQMVADQQTHELPSTAAGLDAFAVFMGYENRPAFEADLVAHLRRVESHYAALFEEAPALTAAEAENGSLIFTGIEDDPGTLDTLRRLGFADPSAVARLVRGWHHGRYRATRTERSRQILTELMPALLGAFGRTPDPDGSFKRFDEFLAGLPAGVQLFSMFHANPRLLSLIADIMGGAPRLAQYLSRHTGALDAVLSPDFFNPPPAREQLQDEVATMLERGRDFEDMLDLSRRWANDRKLQVAVQALQGVLDWSQAGAALSDIAAAAISCLGACVDAEFAKRHGRVPGGAWVVLGMGKLGGREMTPTSDLDLIFVYDHEPSATASDGSVPLEPSRYFARLAQRMINAITAPTSEGKLYDVDMRLRPSGMSGPIASHIDAFIKYHEEQAWTWEHMALTRARVIAGEAGLARRVEEVIRSTLTARRIPAKLRADVADMRERIEREHHAGSIWDVKYLRGGLVDVEFIAQYLELLHASEVPGVLSQSTREALARLAEHGFLETADADTLATALRLWQSVQGMLRLTLDGGLRASDDDGMPEALKRALARTSGEPDFKRLTLQIEETGRTVKALYDRIVGPGDR